MISQDTEEIEIPHKPIIVKKQDALAIANLVSKLRAEIKSVYKADDKSMLLKQVDEVGKLALLEKEHPNVVLALSNMLTRVSPYTSIVLVVLELRRKLINVFLPPVES